MYRPKHTDNWIPRITDMVTYAEESLSFVTASSAEELLLDVLRYRAICFSLIAVGEAAKHVPEEVRLRYPHIEWREIMDFRNQLAHGYDSIRVKLLWNIIQIDLPKLLDQLRDLLQEEGVDSTTPPPQT